MKFLRLLGLFFLLLALGLGAALLATRPAPLDAGLESALRLEPGPYEMVLERMEWIDTARRTDANGDYPGADRRVFDVRVWAPTDAAEPAPLVVYSHGFMANADGGAYLGEYLASYGYVVVSASYPLTNFMAPGGPNADDVINQPGDVSFLIDQALSLAGRADGIAARIDPNRIGAFGTSLGGLTTTLAAYHPVLGDTRIRAAISIAGPTVLFGPDYFENSEAPFLMIAGTNDSMINYDENARPVPDLVSRGGLVSIRGGAHASFNDLASGPMRLLGNPDKIGCRALMTNLEIEEGDNPFEGLGGPDVGMIDARGAKTPCVVTFEEAIPAGRQQWYAMLAARAFFESHFARDPAVRAEHARFLSETMPAELEEVSYEAARQTGSDGRA